MTYHSPSLDDRRTLQRRQSGDNISIYCTTSMTPVRVPMLSIDTTDSSYKQSSTLIGLRMTIALSIGAICVLIFTLSLLVNEAIHNLESVKNIQETTSFTIDNYYGREHRDYTRAPKDELPVLIVGGTDGSGTRAFAQLLHEDLGVNMLSDDAGTLDAHGTVMFNGQGWTELAQLVLSHTKTANYNVSDLPLSVYDKVMKELALFKEHYDAEAVSNPSTKTSKARIRYGFKAPIAMMLLPFLREVYGSIKFVHVVRDGRDVCLSTNKSPVEKYYGHFYGLAENIQRMMKADSLIQNTNTTLHYADLLAMDLWNDWNVQVHEYCIQQAINSQASFDYVVVRTEDFLGTNLEKAATMVKLGTFVGSQKSNSHLKSTARLYKHKDLGKSTVHDQNVIPDKESSKEQLLPLLHRFGKWKARMVNETAMSPEIQKRGSDGLCLFGYNPFMSIVQAELN